jgi:hypothetical protein
MPTVGVVHAGDQRRPLLAGDLEQPPLGAEVVLHVAVEVEVVLREVRERRDVPGDGVGAVQLQGVGADLHDARDVATVAHRAERPLQVDRLGRRAHDGLLDAADPRGDGAQQAGPATGGLQQRPGQERGGRLAVGAGDPDHRQRGRRIAGQPGRGRGHRGAHVVDDDLGDRGAQRVVDDERRRAALDRLGGEVVAVAAEAADAEEDGAGLDHPGVVGERPDVDRGRRQIAEQVAEEHRGDLSDDRHAGPYRGSIFSYCSAKLAILPNAGAATWPPKIEPPCGSSTMIEISSLGSSAGAKPTNDAM